MRHPVIILFLLSCILCLGGCGTSRIVAGQHTQRDSLRTEVQFVYIERIDTAYVEIPREVEKVTTRDTTSTLENDYALSRASITADGGLYHTLETKPQKRPVPVVTKEAVRDSIVYRDRTEYKEVPVEVVRPMSLFRKIQIWGFWILLSLSALYLFIKIKF